VYWDDHGDEHRLLSVEGLLLARVYKHGCCWFAAIGNQPTSSARFPKLDVAKQVAEKLVQDSKEVVRGH
jgi:hypothetical protein